MDLKDKVVVITGASKGIGKALALECAKKGAYLAVTARSGDLLDQLKSEINTPMLTFTGDMSREQDIKAFINAIESQFGGMDVLINNAGFGIFKPVSETTTEEWDSMFNLNMRGLFIITRESLPFLRKKSDSAIVNVASLAGKNAIAGAAGYAATKHAVVGFGKSLMLEERKNGIKVITVCPGSVNTPFFERSGYTPTNTEKILTAYDVAQTIISSLQLADNALVSELEIRPANP